LILTRKQILEEINRKSILIEPFADECLGSNSYDLHLGRYLAVYPNRVLDAKSHNEIEEIVLTKKGHIMHPGTLYLAVSEEYTETAMHVALITGNTSSARLGINVNSSYGSLGHCNTWTLEISVIQPVRVYPGMPIGQIFFFKVDGEIDFSFNRSKKTKYGSRSIKPVESMMWKSNF